METHITVPENPVRRSQREIRDTRPEMKDFPIIFLQDLTHPGTDQRTFTAYNGNTVLGSSTRTFQYNMTASKTLLLFTADTMVYKPSDRVFDAVILYSNVRVDDPNTVFPLYAVNVS